MKKLIAIATMLTALSAQAESETQSFVCKDVEKQTVSTTVYVEELENITEKVPYGNKWDFVMRVHVKVVQQEGVLPKKTIKDFYAISTSEDVQYFISSVKTNGFRMYRYLDEENQDGIVLIAEDGEETRIDLNCVFKD